LSGKFQSGFHIDGIIAGIQKSGVKIVARGGVDVKRVEQINELGFYGMALNTCIWNSKDPIEAYHKIIERCKELNIKVE
jgi:thiamine monophosphate synthase